MANFLLLGVCFALGIALRRSERMPEETPRVLNAYIIHIALPALVLLHIPRLTFEPALLVPALMPWIVFLGCVPLLSFVGRLAGWSSSTVGALILTAGLGNTSFVGLPMIEAFYGPEGLGIGVVADQLGSFLTVSTLGIVVAARFSSGGASLRVIVRRVVTFPPFGALLVAVGFAMFGEVPLIVAEVCERLGDTLAPMALLSVGFQLRLGELRSRVAPLCVGLGYKLILAPAFIALFVLATGARGLVGQVTIFEAAMAPMITGSIIAIEHKLDPPLASLMVGVGIPVSFLTLPLIQWLAASI